MPSLTLHHDYSREAVHAIFSPHTRFTPQAGTWGLHGIVPIPGRHGDFVFFVTFGQQQGEHLFDEGITTNGVLSWQSQPRQALADRQIRQLIAHDELRHTIYLFLRARRADSYTYLGRLKYLSHDDQRSNPVYFQWQLLDWPIPTAVQQRMGLELQPSSQSRTSTGVVSDAGLQLTSPPAPRQSGTDTAGFRARKQPDYSVRDAANRQLGLAGEKLVVEYERRFLLDAGRVGLADQVRHVAVIEGDGAGYDVASFALDGSAKYIEVKTTRGPQATPFYITSNEVTFSKEHPQHYHLYRVYDYDAASDTGKLYILSGDVGSTIMLTPTLYRAIL